MLIKPKHTFASVVRMLADGLADGSIGLDEEPRPTPAPDGGASTEAARNGTLRAGPEIEARRVAGKMD